MFFISKIIAFISTPRSGTEKDGKDPEKSKELDEDYYATKNTYTDGLVHMFRATVGTGILALPVAFSQAGYIGGLLGVVFVTIIANYCANILVKSQKELSRRNKDIVPTFQGTVQAAFSDGPPAFRSLGPIFVTSTNFFILLGQTGGLCVYIVFIASNLKAAVYPHFDIDVRYYALIIFVPILAINMILSLKKLTIVSSLGNTILLTSIAVVLYYCLKDPISLEGKRAFGSIKGLPQFFGTVFFAGVSITMVLPLRNEMAKPEQLQGSCGVINLTAYLYGSLYAAFGLIGYLKYGDSAAGSITLNLPSGEFLGRSVQILLALSVLSATAIHNYISVTIIWDDYLDKMIKKRRTLAQYLIRIINLTFILIVSLLVPNLELLLSVSGVIGQCTLSTTVPCIVHILTFRDQPSFFAYIRAFWLDAIALTLTALVLVCGLASSLMGDR